MSTIAQSPAVPTSEEHSELPPSYDEAVGTDSMTNLPNEHSDIKQFIATKVAAFGGRIRNISPPDSRGRYKFEINGSYRYCENVQRQHRKNQIYFIVDPIKRTYLQKCHDPECYGFQSSLKHIVNKSRPLSDSEENVSMDKCSRCRQTLPYQHQSTCERCNEKFCGNCIYSCDLCHDANHCERCIDLCFDCHDS